MRKSKNEEVQSFMDKIERTDQEKYIAMIEMREIVFTCYPETNDYLNDG